MLLREGAAAFNQSCTLVPFVMYDFIAQNKERRKTQTQTGLSQVWKLTSEVMNCHELHKSRSEMGTINALLMIKHFGFRL